jgi:branched-chain amino acid transport system substrate-binding protein
MKAYFAYINSRKGPDGRRGIFGRQIVFNYYDDGYNPAQTVQATRRLVEEDQVFAIIGALGTEHNEAIRPYLNARKVPQLLNATGASTWGRDYRQYPWTGGWQPDYEYEGRIYGQAIGRNSPNARIAVLYQNDSYGQDYLRGLRAGLAAKASNIAGTEAFEVTATDVRAQVARLRGTGANVFVILATPRFTVQAYVIANALRWSPAVIYTNSVSATDTFLTLAKSSGGGDLPDRTYTVQYLKDPASPAWNNDAAMRLYKQVMSRFRPDGRVTDGLNYYGVAVAHAFTQLMYKAGRNPTRASLMRAYRAWNEPNPFLLPGNRQRTNGADQQPIQCERIAKFTNGTFQPVSKLKCAGAAT